MRFDNYNYFIRAESPGYFSPGEAKHRPGIIDVKMDAPFKDSKARLKMKWFIVLCSFRCENVFKICTTF